MTRARAGGEGIEGWGHVSRAYIKRHEPGKWDAHLPEAGDFMCHIFPTWAEACEWLRANS